VVEIDLGRDERPSNIYLLDVPGAGAQGLTHPERIGCSFPPISCSVSSTRSAECSTFNVMSQSPTAIWRTIVSSRRSQHQAIRGSLHFTFKSSTTVVRTSRLTGWNNSDSSAKNLASHLTRSFLSSIHSSGLDSRDRRGRDIGTQPITNVWEHEMQPEMLLVYGGSHAQGGTVRLALEKHGNGLFQCE
jgi:hypothetical protein